MVSRSWHPATSAAATASVPSPGRRGLRRVYRGSRQHRRGGRSRSSTPTPRRAPRSGPAWPRRARRSPCSITPTWCGSTTPASTASASTSSSSSSTARPCCRGRAHAPRRAALRRDGGALDPARPRWASARRTRVASFAPRPQAGEPARHPAGGGQGHRLRHRQAHRLGRPHDPGAEAGHGALHVSRADPGQAARSAHGRVCAGAHPLRGARGRTPHLRWPGQRLRHLRPPGSPISLARSSRWCPRSRPSWAPSPTGPSRRIRLGASRTRSRWPTTLRRSASEGHGRGAGRGAAQRGGQAIACVASLADEAAPARSPAYPLSPPAGTEPLDGAAAGVGWGRSRHPRPYAPRPPRAPPTRQPAWWWWWPSCSASPAVWGWCCGRSPGRRESARTGVTASPALRRAPSRGEASFAL